MSESFAEALRVAASQGNLDGLKSLFLNHPLASNLCEKGLEEVQDGLDDAFTTAARRGDSDIVNILIENGAQIGPASMVGAAQAGQNTQSIFEVFLHHGWNVNSGAIAPSMFSPRSPGGHFTPVLRLVTENEHLVRWLLRNGADPSLPADPEESPLSAAASRSTVPVVELLIANGANPKLSNALHCAIGRKNQIEIMQCLLDRGANINARKNESDPEAAKLAARRYGTGTPLHEAVRSGNIEALQFLLAKGADPTRKDREGQTAAEVAEDFGHSECAKILNEWK